MKPDSVPPAWRSIANDAESCLTVAQAIEAANLPAGKHGKAVLPALILALAMLRGAFAVANAVSLIGRDV